MNMYVRISVVALIICGVGQYVCAQEMSSERERKEMENFTSVKPDNTTAELSENGYDAFLMGRHEGIEHVDYNQEKFDGKQESLYEQHAANRVPSTPEVNPSDYGILQYPGATGSVVLIGEDAVAGSYSTPNSLEVVKKYYLDTLGDKASLTKIKTFVGTEKEAIKAVGEKGWFVVYTIEKDQGETVIGVLAGSEAAMEQ